MHQWKSVSTFKCNEDDAHLIEWWQTRHHSRERISFPSCRAQPHKQKATVMPSRLRMEERLTEQENEKKKDVRKKKNPKTFHTLKKTKKNKTFHTSSSSSSAVERKLSYTICRVSGKVHLRLRLEDEAIIMLNTAAPANGNAPSVEEKFPCC